MKAIITAIVVVLTLFVAFLVGVAVDLDTQLTAEIARGAALISALIGGIAAMSDQKWCRPIGVIGMVLAFAFLLLWPHFQYL